MMMGDERDHAADDDGADGDDDDDEDGEDGDVCMHAVAVQRPVQRNCKAGRGKRWQGEEVKRREVQRAPPPEAGSRHPPWEAMTAVLLTAQAPGVFPHDGLWAAADALLLLLVDEDRLFHVQSVQIVARAAMAPKLEELCEGNVLARHDVPRPARGRVGTRHALQKPGPAALRCQDPVDDAHR